MRARSRLLAAAAGILAAAGLTFAAVVPAHAATGSGAQWRAVGYTNAPYMNAWGGEGGYVNDYDSSAVNNDFTLDPATGQLFLTNGCNYSNGSCEVVADYGNQSGNARAGTYTNLNGAPWGTYFTESTCSVSGASGYTFHNNHWNGYLDPSGSGGNGTAIYLNGGSAYCWVTYAPA